MTRPRSKSIVDFQTYFETTPPPSNLGKNEEKVAEFIKFHEASGRKMVIVTSGGTTVPLENQTVRFLDNFSAGTRGATSTEYFLEHGYAVVFLHRQFSQQPYARHYSHTTNFFFDLLTLEGDERPTKELVRRGSIPLQAYEGMPTGKIMVAKPYASRMTKLLQLYRKSKVDGTLLMIDFVTITDYLFLLRSTARLMQPIGRKAMFLLAAAVSDFFIPFKNMAEHKIQSEGGSGKLDIHMDPVPKVLKPMVSSWVPSAFVASFKLETDRNLLIPKCKGALERYGHQVVIGNMLSTRKHEVVLVSRHDSEYREEWIHLEPEQVQTEIEIESILIPQLEKLHDEWIRA